MPTNRVVHQLLTGRKRKAQNIGTIAGVDSCTIEKDNDKGTDKSRVKSSSLPLRSQLLQQSENQLQPANSREHPLESRRMVATNRIATESLLSSKKAKTVFKVKLAPSAESVDISSDRIAHQRQHQRQQPKKQSKEKQYRLRNRCKQRYLRFSKSKRQIDSHKFRRASGIEIRVNNHDANMNVSNVDNFDIQQLRRLESLAAFRKRRMQRSQKSEFGSSTVPLSSKSDNDFFAELLIQTFLEQRDDKRLTSQHKTSSFCSSPFDDPMIFPVLLLGVCALCRLTEWFDNKQEETAFSKSRVVRELVLWMKGRQERHTAYTSETIAQRHLDALNQLAKFHGSIEQSHDTSLRLLSRQREEEKLEGKDQHNEEQLDFNVENTALTKTVALRRGLDERCQNAKESVNDYYQTDADNNYLNGGQIYQQLDVKELSTGSHLESMQDSTIPKRDEEPHKIRETAVFRTTVKDSVGVASVVATNRDSTGNGILYAVPKTASASMTLSSSLPISSDDADQRSNTDAPLDHQGYVLKSLDLTTITASNDDTSKPPNQTSMMTTDEAKSSADDANHPSPHSPHPNLSGSKASPFDERRVEGKDGDAIGHEDKNGENSSDLSSDEMSVVLLSQSQKRMPKWRRVTASPRVLSDNKARSHSEKYKQHSKTEFPSHDQNGEQRMVRDFGFDDSSGIKKSCKRKTYIEEPSFSSSQKTWKSRAFKRSPSFKQTSLMSSAGGWVSNRPARNFVKQKLPPTISPMSKCIDRSGKAKSLKEDFFVEKDDGEVRNLTKVGFVDPTSEHKNAPCFNSESRNVPKEECLTQNLITFEMKNPKIRHTKLQGGSQAKSVSEKDNSNGNIDFDISNKVSETLKRNNEVLNNFRCEEVVRGRAEREALNGYECAQCAAFFDEAVLVGNGAKYYDRDELLRCSRHRSRHTPPQTPEDYWELSFMDEKTERLRKR
jgi:hypothetical protein